MCCSLNRGWGNNHVHGFTLYYQHITEDWYKKQRSIQLTTQMMPSIRVQEVTSRVVRLYMEYNLDHFPKF